MSLTTCLKKAGDAIHADDKAQILDRSRELRAEGKSPTDAAKQAVDEQIGKVRAMLEPSKETPPQPSDTGEQSSRTEAASPRSTLPVSRFDAFKAAMAKLYDGELSIDDYRAAYRSVRDGATEARAELNKMTKDELIRTFGIMREGKKDELVGIAYDSMVHRFALGKSYGPQWMTMGAEAAYEKQKAEALDALVEGQTPDDLAAFAKEVAERREQAASRRAEHAKAIADPKTIPEFRAYLEHHMREGKTNREARMSLTPEQRALMDALWAKETRASRKGKLDEQRTTVRVAGQTVDGQIISTKHTKKGHDLFVVRLAERVERADYDTLNAGAKKIGGYYSSYRGGGAIPGFQFTTREQADAFVKLAGGDASEATAAAQERRDAFADDRSQTAVQRLTEMADALEERADESLGRERKANTDRRARMAASAEAEAQSQKALARTMRNIAGAIEAGTADFLDRVRQKVQVEMLSGMVRRAHDDQLRAKYPSYSDFERHKGEAPTAEAADFAEFPSYTAYRSDLAGLGRQLLEVDGTKLLGQRLMKVADDVSDAYLKFAKEPGNLFKLSAFGVRQGDGMRTAIFHDKATAERSLSRSGLAGKGIVFQEKRGVNRIILSPSEAIKRGIWTGDGDKRITLTEEFGAELVAKMGKAARRGAKVSVPWQFETAHDRLKALARMGIETPAEMRAALREFIGLREQAAAPDKVKQLERAMVGKKNDGFDFFPTPEGVADEMVETAGLEPGMRVLEPSAGMGHIAERIRDAGVEPDVGEIASDRRELLEAKGFNLVARDFMDLKEGGYDRILMNPPFSDGRDIAHVRHAYELLKPGGRLVAITGEGAFSQSFKRAEEFREWLETVGGTEEKLPEGTFLDPSLPVNTGANARMVVIDKGEDVRFSRGPARDEHAAWQALSENDELFALPKSRADTIEAIALDIDPAILVERDEPNDRWALTLPGGDKAFIMMREPSPHGPHAFDQPADDDGELRKPTTVRPGEVRWDERMVDDVWLNVSNLKPGHGGAKVYAIAGDFAHNTGRVFIGDPAGVSDDAMRRRSEAMLSSALRWGTTEHLAPHPDQVRGNKAIGMPPLQWKWGDDLGNLRRLIDVTVRALDNAFPSATNIEFDAATGTFRSAVTGKPVSREALGRRLDQLRSDGARQVAASASGGRTVARAAVWRSLLREGGGGRQGGGQRDGLLAQFAGLAGRHRDALKGLFSRDADASGRGAATGRDQAERTRSGGLPQDSTGLTVTGVQSAVDDLTKAWKNAPKIIVAQDMRDPLIPLAVRRHDEHQRSLGASGDVRGFIHGSKVYVIADELPTHAAVAEVVFHEALGHYGLRGVFDRGLDDVLRQMAVAMPDRVKAKAKQYGLDYANEGQRLIAAEEVLAEIAQERPSSTWVQRAIAAIKQWLRDNVPWLADLKMTDADIIALMIEPARRFVEQGAPARAVRDDAVPAFSRSTDMRRAGLPATTAEIHSARDTDALKAHRDYTAAKAGDMAAAERLVRELVRPVDIEAARALGSGVMWAYPHALEATGHNMIPAMLAAHYAAETGGAVADPLIQVNRAFHTGADAMQRLIARPLFDGPVEPGRRYALVDDVSTMGGTLAELANHIQDGGGEVVGVVTLANAGRAPTMPALKQQLREIERRYGQALRDDFQIEPAALTRDEARYVLGFRDADALRSRAAAAKRDRGERLRSKGVQEELKESGEDPDIRFSRGPQHTDIEREALARAGIRGKRSTRDAIRSGFERAQQLLRDRGEMWSAFRQGAFDQFHGISRAVNAELGGLPPDQDPYVAARLANGGTSGVMRALLLHGQARWAANGQHLEKIPDTKGLLDILAPLGDDLNDWFGWMVGNRAARLKREGREHNLTDDHIKALQGLAKGKEALFRKAAAEYAAFKRSVLDVAESAGLIDPAGRAAWDHADHIPFYRQIDSKGSFSATGRKGLAGQSSGIRVLKGGDSALNDPMENLLMNFSRLIDASLKNNAIRKTVAVLKHTDRLEKIGYDMAGALVPKAQVRKVLVEAGTPEAVLDAMPDAAFDGMAKLWAIQAPSDPDVVRVMVGGKPNFYRVADPMLLKALTSFVPFDFPGLFLARGAKRIVTRMVTSTPEFMLANFTRDSVAAQGITRHGFNPAKSLQGILKSYTESGAFEPMLFAGASFQAGNVNAADPTGTAQAMRRALRSKGLSAASANEFISTVVDSSLRGAEHYFEVNEAVENANREAVYEATLKDTGDATAAAYEAKDLMDFSLRGSSAIYQLMADVLPFFNARVQGMYRLGRSDPKRLLMVGLTIMTASLLLAMANDGEDWYEELEDWDKDTYWHFMIGGKHFRLPKPFELGVVFATFPERIGRAFKGLDSKGKTADRAWANVRDQLAIDPTPQIAKPVLEVWANKDTFRNRPIENIGDEGKLPSARFSATTSDTARVASQAMSPVSDTLGLSPKALEHMVHGYFGTVGSYALGLSDMVVRKLEGQPERPEMRLDDLPVVKRFYREHPARATVYESDLYKMREEVTKIANTIRAYRKAEDDAKADALEEREEKKLDVKNDLDRAAKRLANMRKERDEIMRDPKMTPAEKRKEIDELQADRNREAKETMRDPAVIAAQ